MTSDPWLTSDPDMRAVSEELRIREPIFHRPEFGTGHSDFAAMITEDYWEVGASGRRYSRAAVLDLLAQRFSEPQEDPWEISEFPCRSLGSDTFLVAYSLAQGERLTRRSTIWQRQSGQWRARFHQGTVVERRPGPDRYPPRPEGRGPVGPEG